MLTDFTGYYAVDRAPTTMRSDAVKLYNPDLAVHGPLCSVCPFHRYSSSRKHPVRSCRLAGGDCGPASLWVYGYMWDIWLERHPEAARYDRTNHKKEDRNDFQG